MNELEIGVFGNTQQTEFQGCFAFAVLQRTYLTIGSATTGSRPDDITRTSRPVTGA
jgi:hypothetical protein